MSERSHQELRELVSIYAIGAMDAEESAIVESHLEECGECREELDHAMETIALLALAAAPAEPPGHLRDAIVRAAGVDRELRGIGPASRSVPPVGAARAPRGTRIFRLLSPARAVAAVAVACALLAIGVAFHERSGGSSSELQAALQSPGARVLQLSPAAGSTARVVTAPGRRPFFIGTMAPAPGGRTYQLWAIPANGKAVSLGILGSGKVTRSVPTVSGTRTYAVSVEPAGGSIQPTTTPIMTARL